MRGILRSRFGFDVVLMDVRMPLVDGVAATRALRQLADPPPVLVLTAFEDDEILAAALRAGAAGSCSRGSGRRPAAGGAHRGRGTAGRLVLGEGTVKTHVGHLFAELGRRDRAAAIVLAFDTGLVRLGAE